MLVVEGNFDQGLNLVRELAERHNIAVVNSINPDRISGQMTAAYEVCDDLGQAPDRLFIPVATLETLLPIGGVSSATGRKASAGTYPR